MEVNIISGGHCTTEQIFASTNSSLAVTWPEAKYRDTDNLNHKQ